ncbi:MAG: hypothetical protein JJLCMIEE_01247 [Acidimicrobiales bacterium]|nr:MAG: TIGR03084 family protein [Actinomycetota bacterium]MBV6508187.1 hypothetical protein [Acidimicrobiales bacterium]RIK07265.1 MAG: TIGR03084 family protein [Acidobacteriota bacterium]
MDVTAVSADLSAEQDDLDELVADLSDEQWDLDTPSPRWTVADQVAHLRYFDHVAAMAITDPEAFATERDGLFAAAADGDLGVDEFTLGSCRGLAPAELLATWRDARGRLAAAAATLDDGRRINWYGPSMSAKSFLTARLMEVWAHGQDIVDAVGAVRPATDRLRHVAQLGVITRGWSYVNRGLEPPEEDVRVELTSPCGDDTWSWGSEDAPNRVSGPAEDFCLVVTQRRHLDDTSLEVAGEAAREWLELAQAFAGPPTDGPASR